MTVASLWDQNSWNTFPESEYRTIIKQLIGLQLYSKMHNIMITYVNGPKETFQRIVSPEINSGG
jgi:hypothetical protein